MNAPQPPNVFNVRHDTRYHYLQYVGESHQLLRLRPRELAWQQCLSHHIVVTPEPDFRSRRYDSFGNVIDTLHFHTRHNALWVRSEAWIALQARPPCDLNASPAWEQVQNSLRYHTGRQMDPTLQWALECVFESTYVRLKRDFAEYAQQDFLPGTPLLLATYGLMQRIFRDFEFDPSATDVSTPVTTVFSQRRGVCQDFAHLMLSCLRSLGLAARYVSGYLLTHPMPGTPRLIGADASHAWIAVYCPINGWVEFDPTNAVMPQLEHITLGWGRDFADISPMRGVLIGGGHHQPQIAVTVVPQAEFDHVYHNRDDVPLPLLGQPPFSAPHPTELAAGQP